MRTTLSVVLASLAVGCSLQQQEPTGSSGEALGIGHHPTPVQISLSKMVPPQNGACAMPPGWIASAASFDGVVSPLFATEVNPLLAARPPMTIGVLEDGDGTWSMRASATITQGTLQIFPPDHPTTPTIANMSASGFDTSSPIETAWIAVLDATSTLVWIPINNIAVHGIFATGTCTFVSQATVDAVVPIGAGSTSIVTPEAERTLGELLGAGGAGSADGWHVRLTFEASAANVGF